MYNQSFTIIIDGKLKISQGVLSTTTTRKFQSKLGIRKTFQLKCMYIYDFPISLLLPLNEQKRKKTFCEPIKEATEHE